MLNRANDLNSVLRSEVKCKPNSFLLNLWDIGDEKKAALLKV